MQRTATLLGLALAASTSLACSSGATAGGNPSHPTPTGPTRVGATVASPAVSTATQPARTPVSGPAPRGAIGGGHGLASGLVARDGEPDSMPGRIGPGNIQSWVVELEWRSCTAMGSRTWRPGAGDNACKQQLAKAIADARAWNAQPGRHSPARLKIRLRAGQLAPALPKVSTMQFACPTSNNANYRAVTVPQWWDPDYQLAYRQWLGQVNSWIKDPGLPGRQRDARDVVSDVTLSEPMTCFAEAMVRQPERRPAIGGGTSTAPTNAEVMWRAAGRKDFSRVDLAAWQQAIDTHAEVLTIVPTSIAMNPFQLVVDEDTFHPVWDPKLPNGRTLLTHAKARLGHRLVEENNSVGVGDIPGSVDSDTRACPRLASNVRGSAKDVKPLYDLMYCQMRADARNGWATHYQTETAQKFHRDTLEQGRTGDVAGNTASLCRVVDEIAVLQRGLDAEPPVPLQAGHEAHYDPDAACLRVGDQKLETNAAAFARGPRR